MESKQLTTVNSHCAGRCALTWSKTGTLITSGEDAIVNITPKDEELLSIETDDKEVIALSAATKKNAVVIGTSVGDVDLISYKGDKIISYTRMVMGVRSIALTEDEKSIAVAGDENFIRIVNTEDILESQELQGHVGPVRSVAWTKDSKYLASTGTDGECKIWDTSSWDTSTPMLKSFTCAAVDKEADVENPLLCHIDWNPTKEAQLAVSGSKDIVILDKVNSWSVSDRYTDAHGGQPVSIVQWSPNGKYLASVGLDKTIVLWDVTNKTPVAKFESTEFIWGFSWSKVSNAFATIDKMGNLAKEENCIPSELEAPYDAMAYSGKDVTLDETQVEEIDTEDVDVDDVNGDMNDETAAASNNQVEEPADESGTGMVVDPSEGNKENPDTRVEGPLSDEEERRLLREQLDRNDLNDEGGNNDSDDNNTRIIIKEVERAAPKMQLAFQPGETPEGPERRFLAWNEVGAVMSRAEDSYASVEIEFADMTKNRNIRFPDYYGFQMASLSHNGAFFASTGEQQDEQNVVENLRDLVTADDDDLGERAKGNNRLATLFFRSFASWAHNSEWNLQLPLNELVVSVASGSTFCAAATTRGLIRVFRPSGVQEAPISLPGPVLSMVGSGPLLLLLYHRAEPMADGTQLVDYELRHMGDESLGRGGVSNGTPQLVATGRLPTPVAETDAVLWIGFSDPRSGLVPLVLTGDGLLRGLYKGNGWSWTPVLDTHRLPGADANRDLRCWPISMQDNKLSALVFSSKGLYPRTNPRPMLSSFPLQIPLLGLDLAKGAAKHKLEALTIQSDLTLEQRLWCGAKENQAGNPFAPANADPNDSKLPDEEEIENEIYQAHAKIDSHVLKHFLVAVKMERYVRAVGLARRLHLNVSLNIAMVQAQKQSNNPALINRLEELIEERNRIESLREEEKEANDDGEMFDDDDDAVVVVERSTKESSATPTKRKTSAFGGSKTSENKSNSNIPLNPFAKRTKATSPSSEPTAKRRAAALTAPEEASPVKPLLNRSSTFSKTARAEMHSAHKRQQQAKQIKSPFSAQR